MGQALFGWTREAFTMYNHALRAHTVSDKVENFALPKTRQNPFFGIDPALQDLVRLANLVRNPSKELSCDEELVYLLGRCSVKQYVKEKRNRYGPKIFMISGGNPDSNHKGYWHWVKLYKGKSFHRPNVFSGQGKGYEVVMSGILAMELRYWGYWLFCDA